MIIRERYLKNIRPFYNFPMIKIITGVRRSGKSTVLLQIINEIKELGVSDDSIIHISFEDYKYNFIKNADDLYKYLDSLITNDKKYYLFFDEIQNVKEFELVINSFNSTKDVDIYLTGSNSTLLSTELATHLSGRTLNFNIMPFNFREFREYKINLGYECSAEDLFNEYLKYGGFPLVILAKNEEEKIRVLENIYDQIFLRDIILRNNITKAHVLDKSLEYLVMNSSNTLSIKNIFNVFNDDGVKVTSPTLYEYLAYILNASICNKVSRYDIRGKSVLNFEEKVYVCDLGFFNLKKNRVKDEYSLALETLIYNELLSRGYKVYIGKNKNYEIDFIATKKDEKIYLQVCYLLSSESTIEREFRSLLEIDDNYKKFVLSLDKLDFSRDGIKHMNIIDFIQLEKI